MPSVLRPPARPLFGIRTRGGLGPWRSIGLAVTDDPLEDTVMVLEGRPDDRARGRYFYRVVDPDTGLIINLNDGDDLEELYDGDNIGTVRGRESLGNFEVQIDEPVF